MSRGFLIAPMLLTFACSESGGNGIGLDGGTEAGADLPSGQEGWLDAAPEESGDPGLSDSGTPSAHDLPREAGGVEDPTSPSDPDSSGSDAIAEPGPVPDDPGPGPADFPGEEPTAPRPIGRLVVDCDVPTVLDASRTNDLVYMTSHFGDLVQEWGITGTVGGVDLTAYPEKMYYGTHPRDGAYLTLVQVSMTRGLQPVYSVRIDFAPDSAVTTGSSWSVGLEEAQAFAVVVRHTGTSSLCVMGVGLGGTLTFSRASGVTQVEGGTFAVAGAFDVVSPRDLPEVCEALGPGLCCP